MGVTQISHDVFKIKDLFPALAIRAEATTKVHRGKKTVKPYATVVRSRRRGASLGGEVIPDKKKAVCYLPLRFVLLCFSSGLPSAAAGG